MRLHADLVILKSASVLLAQPEADVRLHMLYIVDGELHIIA